MRAKIHITAIALTISLFAASSVSAQLATQNDPFNMNETTSEYALKTFTAQLKNNKVYVNWTATDTKGDCVYIIERSADGVNYQKLTAKKGAPSPGTAALLYSYTDEQPLKGTSYYRVQQLGSNGTIQTITQVTNGNAGKNGDGVACSK